MSFQNGPEHETTFLTRKNHANSQDEKFLQGANQEQKTIIIFYKNQSEFLLHLKGFIKYF